MATLLLRLAAPMQSWGADSKFEVRKTNREPTKSGVVGLLAAALGLRRNETEALYRLNRLRYAVRVDREGSLLVDLHTAGNLTSAEKAAGKKEKATYLTRRYYLADAVFLVGLESEDRAFLEQLAAALCRPAFPLFLGRRSCPPTQPVCLGIRNAGLLEALHAQPPLLDKIGQTHQTRNFRIVTDAAPEETGAVPRHDLPLSFSPIHRQYGYRAVREIIDTPPVTPEETTHDPFAELR